MTGTHVNGRAAARVVLEGAGARPGAASSARLGRRRFGLEPANAAQPGAGSRPAGSGRFARMPRRTAFWSVAVGIVAFAVSWLGSWVPSFWGDEAASIMSAQRSWGSLLDELVHVDAVHGTFYALLHVWIEFFGTSPLATRMPSALAVGLAAAGIVVLVRRYGGLRLGILAALVFAVLPRTTYMGAEVRSYALSAACAVWLAALFLRLVTRRTRRALPWAVFAVGFAASIYVYFYLCLLVLPFAALLMWEARGRLRAALASLVRPRSAGTPDVAGLRAVTVRWLLATVGGVVLAAPLEWFALRQSGQIGFLARRPGVNLYTFTVTQWFDSGWGLAIVAWAALIALAVAGALTWRRRRVELPRMLRTARARLIFFAAAWLALPPVALLGVNAVIPAYSVRYLSFATPAMAILLAVAIDAAARWASAPMRTRRRVPPPRRWMPVVASLTGLALVGAVAAPAYLAQRGPYAKNGSDWAQLAGVIQQHAKAGDDIVFDETTRPSRRPRLAMHVYPQQFAGVVDVTLDRPYTNVAGLWDTTYSIDQVAPRIDDGNGRVWLVEERDAGENAAVDSAGTHRRMDALTGLGFDLSRSYPLHRDVVYLFTRGAAS
jgi:mannosyltransferase